MSPIFTGFAVFGLAAAMILVIAWASRRAYRHGTGVKSAATVGALACTLFVVLKHAA